MGERCEVCGRGKGERRPKCLRCPGTTPREKMLPEPLPGRFLVVDPGSKSGWAIMERNGGEWAGPNTGPNALEHGEGSVWSSLPMDVCAAARRYGCDALIIEDAAVGMDPIVAAGLGASRGVWKWHWRNSIKADSDRAVIVEFYPSTWRATIIGGGHRDTAAWKRDAIAHVHRTLDLDVGPEAAEAICLGEHAMHSLDTADALGVRRMTKLGWVEPKGCWVGGTFVPAEVP